MGRSPKDRIAAFIAAKKKGMGYVAAVSKAYPLNRPWGVVEGTFYGDLEHLMADAPKASPLAPAELGPGTTYDPALSKVEPHL